MKKIKKMKMSRVLVALSAATTIKSSANVASAARQFGKTVMSLPGGIWGMWGGRLASKGKTEVNLEREAECKIGAINECG